MSSPEAPAPTDSFRPVLGATVFLVLALLAIAALKSSRDLQSARQREKQLAEQITETRKRSDQLKTRIERLQNDPGLLERLAREDLGMVRPHDVVIQLPEAAGVSVPSPAALPAPVPAETLPSPQPSIARPANLRDRAPSPPRSRRAPRPLPPAGG